MAGLIFVSGGKTITGLCTWPFVSFCRFVFVFPRVSARVMGNDNSLVKNLNMSGELIDVVGNTV